jgi:uncharacterized membrane protein
MGTFVITLHVIAVVLLVGPMVVAAFSARRGIKARDAKAVQTASRVLTLFGFGYLLVGLLGVLAVSTNSQYRFGAPWVVISITLFVVILALVFGYNAPATHKAARMIRSGALDTTLDAEPEMSAPVTPPTDEPQQHAGSRATTGQHLAEISARITLTGLLTLLGVVLIVILMVVKPFGT